MTDWQDIETAPRDGTVVRAGRISVMSVAGQPLYPLPSRFLDGKWKCCMGDDRWAEYDPQPTVWQPLPLPSPPSQEGAT